MKKKFVIRGTVTITGHTKDDDLVEGLRDEILSELDGMQVPCEDGEHSVDGELDVLSVDYE